MTPGRAVSSIARLRHPRLPNELHRRHAELAQDEAVQGAASQPEGPGEPEDRPRFVVLLTGDVASVDAAVAAGCEVAASEGILVGRAVIARPRRELFSEYV